MVITSSFAKVFILILFAQSVCFASDSASISGEVTGPAVPRVAGCRGCVVLIEAASRGSIACSLDQAGHFEKAGLAPGEYRLELRDPDSGTVIRALSPFVLAAAAVVPIHIDTGRPAYNRSYTEGDLKLATRPLTEYIVGLFRRQGK